MHHPDSDPPLTRPWRVTAAQPNRPLLVAEVDLAGHAAALAAVLTTYWPGLVATCRRPSRTSALTSSDAA